MVAQESKRTPEDMPPFQGSICVGPQSRGWHPGLWYAALSGLWLRWGNSFFELITIV
ncbi:hypothetical protein CYPRO_1578 [Cyclonatronum proteinivorum]|uniref:Uncharacterized protein n=1 Tax=Cyclonatronum proteinivorum TaxID=1457365 RepID=A0A345UK27_9BACT|nr:hypothetical protein CYPRO_1578 [Cyclonatronum proteinivorum]